MKIQSDRVKNIRNLTRRTDHLVAGALGGEVARLGGILVRGARSAGAVVSGRTISERFAGTKLAARAVDALAR